MQFFNYFYNDEMDQFFFKKPQYFDKYTNHQVLAYGLGGTLYMPATRPSIHQDILSKKHEGLTSLVIDLEDAIGDHEVGYAEALVTEELCKLYREIHKGFLNIGDFPLLFIRTRNADQLKRIIIELGEVLEILTGVVLPKFSPETGGELLEEIQRVHSRQHPFYAMPILETANVIYKETRIEELMKIKNLLDSYKDTVLNVRIGATDFSGLYGIRRRSDTTVYEISVIRDCITDIINLFGRQECPYVISGPVWEYFASAKRSSKPEGETRSGESNTGLIDQNLNGMMKEVVLDIANGLTGKTIIHPSHIKVVQALNAVSYEEYIDALNITATAMSENGVIKSAFANKMNEVKPHYNWAQRILLKSQLYGVLNEEYTNIDLIKRKVYI